MSRKQQLEDTLNANFTPSFLSLIDESSQHRGRDGQESHFKLVMVSKEFEGLSRVERHQMVNRKIKFAFDEGLHAFSMQLFSPTEWTDQAALHSSPQCVHKK